MTRRLHRCRCAAATLREVGGEGEATAKNCYDTGMSLPFDGKRLIYGGFEMLVDV